MGDLYEGCMTGRTMYVIPFVMGHIEADVPMYGVEVTDSAYVVVSMKIMARIGTPVLRAIEEQDAGFVKGLHSVGFPLTDGRADVAWPCSETKYIAHFPETGEIWSYGSGYGGIGLLGKKCYALRIASAIARNEGWRPSTCSSSSSPRRTPRPTTCRCLPRRLRQDQPRHDRADPEGWTVETVGDDIAWMRFGQDGRLYAINPEYGLFGVAPGTDWRTNPNAMRTVERATRSSPTSPSPTTATSGGRAWASTSRRT